MEVKVRIEGEAEGEGEGRAPAQPPAGQGSESPLRRIVSFVRHHPVASLAMAAGAGVLGGAEWVVGAIVGGSAVTLLTTRRGADLRKALEGRAKEAYQWGRERAETLRASLRNRGEPGQPQEQ